MERWTLDRAQSWYAALPYLFGANFIPSYAINQLEMWQEATFDPGIIDKELGMAASIGMNVMRVYLHDLLWDQDPEGFCQRIDTYLSLAHARSIRTMFVLFDDCWNQESHLGPQPAPKPYTHNSGWVQSPGVRVVNDPTAWERLERYVTSLLDRFRDDERILSWDLYNEPGNGVQGDASGAGEVQGVHSLPLLRDVFTWARSVEGLTQPLTVGVWKIEPGWEPLIDFSLSASDIVTFHSYEPPAQRIARIQLLEGSGRPMICTEYMARTTGSTFQVSLRVLKQMGIGAINWGLTAGKTQTIYPWGWDSSQGEPLLMFHDIFHQDGSFLYPEEACIISHILSDPQPSVEENRAQTLLENDLLSPIL